MDLDFNGEVTTAEFKKMYSNMGHPISDKVAVAELAGYDMNHDNKVTFNDFFDYMTTDHGQ